MAVVDYGFPLYLQNVSALRGRGSREPSGPDLAGVRELVTSRRLSDS